MDAAQNPLRRAVFRFAETGAALSARHHRARLLGAEHLPARGPVLLVGNHGLWGDETPAFFHLIHHATGRYSPGQAERGFFKIPLVRTVLPWLGGVEGTRDKAARIPGSRLEVIREASHLPYMSHTGSLNAFTGDFLARHDT